MDVRNRRPTTAHRTMIVPIPCVVRCARRPRADPKPGPCEARPAQIGISEPAAARLRCGLTYRSQLSMSVRPAGTPQARLRSCCYAAPYPLKEVAEGGVCEYSSKDQPSGLEPEIFGVFCYSRARHLSAAA